MIATLTRPKADPAMPTTDTTPNRETWKDWMPPGSPSPPLLSHDELMDELEKVGVPLSPHTLTHWRRIGVIPRPIRRRYKGVTRPVYPHWLVLAIADLRYRQSKGESLEEITPIMRKVAIEYSMFDLSRHDHPRVEVHTGEMMSLVDLLRELNVNQTSVTLEALITAVVDAARMMDPSAADQATLAHITLRAADGTETLRMEIPLPTKVETAEPVTLPTEDL